jgi:16S rRNA (adenine1518-N6/adenine1519-N6)-dimethyltransferase
LLKAGPLRLYTIEIDRRFSSELEPLKSCHPHLEIIWCDALSVDYRRFFDYQPDKIVANIPYQIITELLWKLLEEAAPAGTGYFLMMVQKEAAERLSARPGSRRSNPLSVTLARMGTVEILKTVPPEVFQPRPKVQSAIVQIHLNRTGFLKEENRWRYFVERAYRQRRKTLFNNLVGGLHLERAMILEWFEKLGIGSKQRAEELDTQAWGQLYEEWVKSGGRNLERSTRLDSSRNP